MSLPVQIVSDIHLNFDLDPKRANVGKKDLAKLDPDWLRQVLWFPEVTSDTLFLAGDVFEGIKFLRYGSYSWLSDLSAKYRRIYLVLGNHDYYGVSLTSFASKVSKLIAELGLTNVVLLNNSAVQLEDGSYLWGGTGWWSLKSLPASGVYYLTEQLMPGTYRFTDFKEIKVQGRRLAVRDIVMAYREAEQSLLSFLSTKTAEDRVHVMTHMPYTRESLFNRPPESDDLLDVYEAMEASDVTHALSHPAVVTHIHGHLHNCFDIQGAHCRIICNPRGYVGDVQRVRDPSLLVPFESGKVFHL